MAYAATTSPSIVNRMIRAARLEVPLYEEVEADTTATNQALLVVVMVAAAAGIAGALGAMLGNAPPLALVSGLIGGILSALIGWAVWSYVVFFVGTRFMGGTATYGELLRTLGFAQAPRVLLIFSFIPVVGGIVSLVVAIWAIVASFIATRQALDVDNTKTFITILIGVVAFVIVAVVISFILGLIFAAGVVAGRVVP